LFDLSLSEIAEEDGGTRQSVYDAVKKVKKKLLEYEKALGIKEKKQKFLSLLDDIKDEKTATALREILER
jgi:predicted DNA-binding protein YlxM (UPF0122 family)